MNDLKPVSVMLLDDERLLLDLYEKGLKDAGYDTTSFTSPTHAIEALKEGAAPDIILFDINMGDMSGFDFIETVKKETLAPKSIMVALTNESKEEDTKRIMDLGASGHFVKSQLSPTDLVAAVKGVMMEKK